MYLEEIKQSANYQRIFVPLFILYTEIDGVVCSAKCKHLIKRKDSTTDKIFATGLPLRDAREKKSDRRRINSREKPVSEI